MNYSSVLYGRALRTFHTFRFTKCTYIYPSQACGNFIETMRQPTCLWPKSNADEMLSGINVRAHVWVNWADHNNYTTYILFWAPNSPCAHFQRKSVPIFDSTIQTMLPLLRRRWRLLMLLLLMPLLLRIDQFKEPLWSVVCVCVPAFSLCINHTQEIDCISFFMVHYWIRQHQLSA